ncbi:hypothetical protein HNR60_002599 [Rhodopseudomonas rhenobacensis]|uniref:DUF3574 domain-containing protein n=1 Tax=Rhodopseudomonas rhenobacensis TaxID=87461 RepID=A0A7W7Z4G3_9BRAD|nr:DUF3574 domain-containing protein [Rhodopseudomonas rhenobacensis]MBB5047842.1 hypothetical protein [Rhodopseudomonas rhenobacensis]
MSRRDLTTRAGLAAVVVSVLALGGCASLPQACVAPSQPMLSAELMFGRTLRGGVVSEAAFARFVADEVTPRFPDGLTVLDSHGQWRNPATGVLVREPSKVLQIVFADDPDKRAALTDIAEAYKRQFRQQSVLIALHGACVSF